ncbi:MAG: type IV pili methyl-accepting chemotaxis transducer N-terminal domain-containing protein [Eikenella sp.]|nr:type IV pili methyl-accepting chemotaxis transducer N-terminal domain-containing protein [Eikenella sp.]
MPSFYPKSLSTRLKLLTALWVAAAVGSIILTLLLSWRLEGSAAAINDAGRLRMQTYRLGLMLRNGDAAADVRQKVAEFDATLRGLEQGDPARPLFLPDTPQVKRHLHTLQRQWAQVRLMVWKAAGTEIRVDETRLQSFVGTVDDLVSAVEDVNARHTYWLRLFQSCLMVMVLLSACVMVLLLYLWIIRPLDELQNGVKAVHDGQFGVQVPVDDLTEFAHLDRGFNQMSSRLQQLYAHLEQEVVEKTRDLATKNYTLETLYFFSRFLGQTQASGEACEMFLQKIMALVPAKAGSIRLLDFSRRRMDLIAHTGLPDALQTAEACRQLDDCFCGHSVSQGGWQPIRFYQRPPAAAAAAYTHCEQAGFHYLQIFKIRYNDQELGMMTLYFEQEYALNTASNDLLEALCNQLGLVLTNIRLADESRQLAVLQERNLMAQGLHDSIAQTLTFLNLQVQMLDSALQDDKPEQVAENLQFIKEGVQECYEDVRELLLNFRTQISRKEFAEAVQTLADRFEQQTQVPVTLSWQGDGPGLNSEQQLQFIFILQESLSNIRKHAHAHNVAIAFDNRQDFVMTITDDGRGFDPADLSKQSGNHVGLNIMRERALRIHARLELDSSAGGGHTRVCLTLPQQERILI